MSKKKEAEATMVVVEMEVITMTGKVGVAKEVVATMSEENTNNKPISSAETTIVPPPSPSSPHQAVPKL